MGPLTMMRETHMCVVWLTPLRLCAGSIIASLAAPAALEEKLDGLLVVVERQRLGDEVHPGSSAPKPMTRESSRALSTTRAVNRGRSARTRWPRGPRPGPA